MVQTATCDARLAGKVVMITGGARGMGASHARHFVAQGSKVVITDLLDEAGEGLARELGDAALYLHHDVAASDQWCRVIAAIEARFGRLDVLVNNAGIVPPVGTEMFDEAFFHQAIAVNLASVFLGAKWVTPAMIKAGGGSIINIASAAGLVGMPGPYMSYAASKWAVRGLTKSLAISLARSGIRVNAVLPGTIDTPMTKSQGEDAYAMAQTLPIPRAGTADEVSSMVLFLAGDQSSYVTGAEFVIDGGATASPVRFPPPEA